MGDLKGTEGSAKQPRLRLKGLGQAEGLGQLGGSRQPVGCQAFSNLNPRPGRFSKSGTIKFQLCFLSCVFVFLSLCFFCAHPVRIQLCFFVVWFVLGDWQFVL